MPLFTIEEKVAVDYPTTDGQLWSNEVGAQNYNAELVMVKILGRKLLEQNGFAYTTIHNLLGSYFRPTPISDIQTLIALLDHHLAEVQPQFEALKGQTFSYGTGKTINVAGQTSIP